MSYFGVSIRNGLPIGLGSLASLGMSEAASTWVYSPADLFAAGEVGVWFDPSDMTTLFQDAAATIPVTALEQQVGLMLDKSKGLVQTTLVSDTFDSGTGGYGSNYDAGVVLSNDAGRLKEVTGSSAASYLTKTISVQAGDYLVVEWDYSGATDVSINAFCGIPIVNTVVYSGGHARCAFFASGTQLAIRNTVAASATTYFDNITVKKIAGYHAYQSNAASKATLSARYNLLTQTENFSAAVWGKTNAMVTANATAAPDGTTTADKLVESAATGAHFVIYTAVAKANTSNKVSFYLQQAGRSAARIYFAQTGAAGYLEAQINLATGEVHSSSKNGTAPDTPVVTCVADREGFWLVSVTGKAGTLDTTCYVQVNTLNQLPAPVGDSYAGDGTSGIYIWGASLVPANQADLPYQRVGAAVSGTTNPAVTGVADYDSDPTKFPWYLKLDGIDDGMSTPSIPFVSDKVTVFAGVRKLSDAAIGVVVESSIFSGSISYPGSFMLTTSGQASAGAKYGCSLRGTDLIYSDTPASFAAPISNVVSLVNDIAQSTPATEQIMRVNGIQTTLATVGVGAGTGNFNSYPLYLFRRGGTSLPFNGHFYGLIVRGAETTAEDIAFTETYMASKTGVTL